MTELSPDQLSRLKRLIDTAKPVLDGTAFLFDFAHQLRFSFNENVHGAAQGRLTQPVRRHVSRRQR